MQLKLILFLNFLCLETKKVTKKIQEKLKLQPTRPTHPRHFFRPTHFHAKIVILKIFKIALIRKTRSDY